MRNFSLKTRESSLHNSRVGKNVKVFLWVFVVFLLLFFSRGIMGVISTTFTTPLYYVQHYIETSAATVPVFIRSRMELLEQIRDLEEKVASNVGVESTLEFVTKENTELRTLLGATSTPRIVSGVIARPPYTPYDTIVIDRGSADGIRKDAPVYFGSNHALGYVRSVYEHHALVTLFSSSGVESTVYVFGPNFFTTAYGEGGGIVRLSVPQGVIIETGNIVILPSLDTGVIGVIDHIQSIPTEPEQHAYVTFDVPMQSLRLVSVGTVPLTPVTFDEAEEMVNTSERLLFTFPVPPELRFEAEATSTDAGTTHASSSTSTPIE